MEALDLVQYLLPANISLMCFDFPGCGLSDGEYISLGWNERDDLLVLVDYMRAHRNVNTIGLWGRSMGAVTCLLHGDRDPSIGGLVLDSPFSNLKKLVNELAKKHTSVPGFLLSAAIWSIKRSIKSKAGFDIEKLSPIDHVKECFIPALFATGEGDDFIDPTHTQELHAAYAGDKNLVMFEGDHNSHRPDFFLDSVVIFFMNTL
jgi:acetyl esterase/lipase